MQAITDLVIHYGGLALLHGTVLALATWALSTLLRDRVRPAVQAALWTVALVKFLLPPLLPGEMALSGWINKGVTRLAAERPIVGVSCYPSASGSVADAPIESPWGYVVALLLICYLAVIILMGVRIWRSRWRTRSHLRALPLADESLRAEVVALAKSTRLKLPPEVRTTDEKTTLYVYGSRRAVLVLPQRLMEMLEASERRAFILHELAHLHRRDQLIRWLQSLACILFFFFPPVRWVCRRIEHFTEIACDKWAVAVSGIAPEVYAAALVRVVKELSRSPQAEAGLQLLPGVKRLKSRLQAVLQDEAGRPPQKISTRARLAVLVWALFALAGGSLMEACESSAPLAKLASETTIRSGPTIERGSKVRSAPGRAAKLRAQPAVRSAGRAAERVGADQPAS